MYSYHLERAERNGWSIEEEMDDWKSLEAELIKAAQDTDPLVQLMKKQQSEARKSPEVQSYDSGFDETEKEIEEEEKETVVQKKMQKKPEGVPFFIMVYLALRNSGGRGINVKEMYAFVQRVFMKYHHNNSETWKNSVRHQLAQYKTSLIQEGFAMASQYKLKNEYTELHAKFDQFCLKNPHIESVLLAEDISWKMVVDGLVGIPKVEKKPRSDKSTKKRSTKRKLIATDDEADAVEALLGSQKKFRAEDDLTFFGI